MTAATTEDGELYTFGKGDDGALGTGTREHRLVPTRVGGAGTGAFNGTRVVMSASGSCKNGAPGAFHSAVVTEDGAVWTMGTNIVSFVFVLELVFWRVSCLVLEVCSVMGRGPVFSRLASVAKWAQAYKS